MASSRFSLLRCGTSRGPFFRRDVLRLLAGEPAVLDQAAGEPLSPAEVDVVLNVVGSGSPGQIDGVGGGSAVTSKACVVAPWLEPDGTRSCTYWFLQCGVSHRSVDGSHGDCGNMLAGVAPFAKAAGLVPADAEVVRVLSQQTSKIFELQQRARQLVQVHGLRPVGATTGVLWPAGGKPRTTLRLECGAEVRDVICVDAVRSLVAVPASEVGMTCHESKKELDDDMALMARLESIRLAAAREMGLGDCSGKVAPKLLVFGPPTTPAACLNTRYFVAPFERDTHPSLAMSAAQALAVACCHLPELAPSPEPGSSTELTFEHLQGSVAISVDLDHDGTVSRTGYCRSVKTIAVCN